MHLHVSITHACINVQLLASKVRSAQLSLESNGDAILAHTHPPTHVRRINSLSRPPIACIVVHKCTAVITLVHDTDSTISLR